MTTQSEEIVNREFSRAFLGYDIREVDEFLDTLIDRFEKLETQRKQMLIAMEYLLKRLEDADDLPADVRRTLAASEKALRRLTAPDGEPASGTRGKKETRRGQLTAETRRKRAGKTERALADDAPEQTDAPEPERFRPELSKRAEKPDATSPTARAAVRVGRARPTEPPESAPQDAEQMTQPSADTYTPQDLQPERRQAETVSPTADGAEPEAEPETDAQDVDALIPELLNDLEFALADGAVRAASGTRKDEPVRGEAGRAL